MMFNFKLASRDHNVEAAAVPFVTVPISYVFTKFLFNWQNRKGAQNA